jgi:hypothetical protein
MFHFSGYTFFNEEQSTLLCTDGLTSLYAVKDLLILSTDNKFNPLKKGIVVKDIEYAGIEKSDKGKYSFKARKRPTHIFSVTSYWYDDQEQLIRLTNMPDQKISRMKDFFKMNYERWPDEHKKIAMGLEEYIKNYLD